MAFLPVNCRTCTSKQISREKWEREIKKNPIHLNGGQTNTINTAAAAATAVIDDAKAKQIKCTTWYRKRTLTETTKQTTEAATTNGNQHTQSIQSNYDFYWNI